MTLKGKPKKKNEPTGTAKWKLISAGVVLVAAAAVAAWWIGECDREERQDEAAARIEGHFAKTPGHDVTAEIAGSFRDLLGAQRGIDLIRELAKKHGRIAYHDGLRTVWYAYRQGTIGTRQACVGTVCLGRRPAIVHAGFGRAIVIDALRLEGDTLTITVIASTTEVDKPALAALGLEPGGRYEAKVEVSKLGDRHVSPKELGPYAKAPAPVEAASEKEAAPEK